MREMEYGAFLKSVGMRSALGMDHDSVVAAVKREEVAQRGKYYQERIQAVADEVRQRTAGWRRVSTQEKDGNVREIGLNPEAAFIGRAFAKRLQPWAQELRKEVFGSPDAPFLRDLAAAANWIEAQAAADRERWIQDGTSRLDTNKEIKRLADLAGLVVKPVSLFLKYVKPEWEMQQTAPAFPGTSLDRLARETDRVSEKTAFQPETLTGFVLTGLQPMISRVRITKSDGGCLVPGDTIPYRSVILEFNVADVSYDEVRALYAEIRKFFGVTDAERLSWHEFDFISLVDSMGGPPKQYKTRFWEEALRRWKEEPASKSSKPLNSWRAARNKFERLARRRNLHELILPNPPMTLAELKHLAETGDNRRSLKSIGDDPVKQLE